MFYENDFEIKVGMKKFFCVNVLETQKDHNVAYYGFFGFETKEKAQAFINRVRKENAYLFFNLQKIKLKYGRVKVIK